MNQFDNVMGCFPMPIQMQMDNLDDEIRGQIEEIRVYKGKKVRLIIVAQLSRQKSKIFIMN